MSAKLKLLPIKSGWLVGAHYSPRIRKMTVQMKSGTYEYDNIQPKEYRAFAATFQSDVSSGSHFGKHFRQRLSKKIG